MGKLAFKDSMGILVGWEYMMRCALFVLLISLLVGCGGKTIHKSYKEQELVVPLARTWSKKEEDKQNERICSLNQHNMQVTYSKKHASGRIQKDVLFGAWDPKGSKLVMEIDGRQYITEQMEFSHKEVAKILKAFENAGMATLTWYSQQNKTVKIYPINLAGFKGMAAECQLFLGQTSADNG